MPVQIPVAMANTTLSGTKLVEPLQLATLYSWTFDMFVQSLSSH